METRRQKTTEETKTTVIYDRSKEGPQSLEVDDSRQLAGNREECRNLAEEEEFS